MDFVAHYEKIVELEGQQSKLWEPCSGQVYMSTVHQNYGKYIDGKKTVILMWYYVYNIYIMLYRYVSMPQILFSLRSCLV